MARCPQIKVLFGEELKCLGEWDHLGAHHYHAKVEQAARMIGKVHIKTKLEKQLELCLGDDAPEGFKSL